MHTTTTSPKALFSSPAPKRRTTRRRLISFSPLTVSLAVTLGVATDPHSASAQNTDRQQAVPAQANTGIVEPSVTPSDEPPGDVQGPAEGPRQLTNQLTKPPVLRRFVAAVPDATAMPIGRNTHVLLALTVQADGTVADVEVLTPRHPALDAAAVTAVRQFVFDPAEVDGIVSAVRIQYEYVYPAEVAPRATTRAVAPLLAPVPTPAVKSSGRLEGRVLESGTRQPIIGASVTLPQLGIETETDAAGHFVFKDVQGGSTQVVIVDSHHARVEDVEEVRLNATTNVTYYTEPLGFVDDDLVAIGRKVNTQVVRHELAARELSTLPGSNGDALKAVQNLPGVTRTTGDQVILRGEGNGLVLVNGHPIMSAFHFGGVRSTVGNGMIESLQVTPGNYDAKYGNTNAGVVDIVTRRPRGDALHGCAELDVFDAGLFLEGPASEHATFAVGGRRSYIDAVLNLALSDDDKVTFSAAPSYHDYQATYDWQAGKHRMRVNGFGSDDRMVMHINEPAENDPAVRGTIDTFSRWVSGQILWDYRPSEQTMLSSGLSYLWGDFSLALGKALQGRLSPQQVTLRSDLSQELSPWLSLRAGLHLTAQDTSYGATGPRNDREGQLPAGLSALPSLSTKGTVALYNPAGYLATDITLGKLSIVPAVRIDHFSNGDQLTGVTLVQPRLDMRWAATATTTIKAAAGMYSRSPNVFQIESTFGNDDLQPELSLQYSAGVEQRLGDAISLSAVGFYKKLYHQISSVSDPNVKLDNHGRGRVYGAEVLLKHQLSTRFYGWVAYTISRSERRESEDDNYYLYDFDQTHNLTLVGQYRLTPTWELGARFRYVSGNPSTPVTGATYDSDADIYIPTYGSLNSDRIDAFHQLDVRVDKHFIFDTWQLTAYLDVQNAYNRTNPQSLSYNYNYTQSKPSPGLNLPLIPSFGVKGEF